MTTRHALRFDSLLALAAALTAIGALSACEPSTSVDNVPGGGAEPAPLNLGDAVNRESYALGYQVASNLQQGASINPEALQAGIADRLSGEDPQIAENLILDALNSYQQRTMKQQGTPAQPRAERTDNAESAETKRQASKRYLDENRQREGVVVTDSGLQYEVLSAGDDTQPRARAQDEVVVHYKGELVDGTEFDSSHKRGQPATFPVNRVIAGWQEALQLMPVGAKWRLTIPSELAYGANGPPSIGAHATLVFEVELLEARRK